MMSQEWLSIIAAWEFLFALLLLFAGSLVHWRKAKHNLLLLAAIGFAVAVAGNAYLSYIIFFPGVLSSTPQTIQGAYDYATERMAYASFITALGLAIAAVSYLFFVLRTKSS